MKKVLTVLGLMVTLGFGAPIDGYMQSLANEAKKADPSFKGFDAVSGKQIFTSEHIGKKGQNISCAIGLPCTRSSKEVVSILAEGESGM